jgi:hypothetical protein
LDLIVPLRITTGAYSRWARHRVEERGLLGWPRGISCRRGRRAVSRALHFRGCWRCRDSWPCSPHEAVHRVADLAPSGARAIGCFDGGADMCAQLWAPKAQVGGGEGLKLVVVEGRVRPRPGCGNRSGYPTRALERCISGVDLEVLGVLGAAGQVVASLPGGRAALARTQRALCFARSISAVSSC